MDELYEGIVSKLLSKYKKIILIILLIGLVISILIPYLSRNNGTNSSTTGKINSEAKNLVSGESKVNGINLVESKDKVAINNSLNEKMFVEVAGAVRRPGVYEATFGARVVNMIDQAGGFSKDSFSYWISKNFNLADRVSDSQKIYIPYSWEASLYDTALTCACGGTGSNSKDAGGSSSYSTFVSSSTGDTQSVEKPIIQSSSTKTKGSLINVNKDSLLDLDTLPGIGQTYAQRIYENRPFRNFDDLEEKSKIPSATLAKIKNLIIF